MTTIDKAEALAPCPFCGGEAELWNAHDNRPAWIACMGRCAVLISKEHATDAEAIAAWNRRAALSPAPTDAAHVNETPKSEHDAGNVLTAPDAQEAAQAEIAKLKAERDAFAEVCRGLAADVLSLSERLGGKDG